MNFRQKELLIARITSGTLLIPYRKTILKVNRPNKDLMYEAQAIYEIEYNKCLNQNVYDDTGIKAVLIDKDMWSEDKQNEIDDVLPNHIEYWKVELFKSYFRSNQKARVRKYLKVAKDEYNRLNRILHAFDHMTCHGLATLAKIVHYLKNSTYHLHSNKRCNWYNISIQTVLNKFNESFVEEATIRELARSSPWDLTWTAGKNFEVFGIPSCEMTMDQQRLVMWSSLYDNIKESPDAPADDVFDDDDMLDGWLISQKKDRDGQRNVRLAESKLSNHSEQYVKVDTQDDADKIYDLNTDYSRSILQQRMNLLEEKGMMKQQEFPDVQRDRSIAMSQAYNEMVKGQK